MDALSSLATASSTPIFHYHSDEQQEAALALTPVSKPRMNSIVTSLPTPLSNASESVRFTLSSPCVAPLPSPTRLNQLGYMTLKSKANTNQAQAVPSSTPTRETGKRKRTKTEDDIKVSQSSTPTKRKAKTDYLRKGQWTSTEERLVRLLIEAFEEGYLPIYTGIRLRGYLAVQLQCDPMRVSKKLCAGTIDGKPMPKNYGQKKFKLRKKNLWDSDEAVSRISELESLTKAMWTEARIRKPSYLTLSSTRSMNNKKRTDDDRDVVSLPPQSVKRSSVVSTPRSKKQKMFPIIYINLSKLKYYVGRNDNSDGDPASSSSKESDSDGEPVGLDGESLQAAYDLLTLSSPRGTALDGKAQQGKTKKITATAVAPALENKSIQNDFSVEGSQHTLVARDANVKILIKNEQCECHCGQSQ